VEEAVVTLVGVQIICDDASHARGKVTTIEQFVRGLHSEDDPTWRKRGDSRRSAEYLRGDTPSPRPTPWVERPGPVDRERIRYDLECKLCGLKVPARRDRLLEVLDALAANGVRSITLRGLAARLSGKQ